LIEWAVLVVIVVLLLVGWSRIPRAGGNIVGIRFFGSTLLIVGAIALAIWVLIKFLWVIAIALILVGIAAYFTGWLRRS